MSEFRKRVLDPVLPPIVAIGFVFVLVYSVSNILLAIPEKGSTTLALLLAAEVLGIAAVLAATSRIKASQRLVMLFMGLGLIGGGAAAASIGVRPIEAHGHNIAIAAKAIDFTSDTLTFPVEQEVTLLFNNQDTVPHNVAITKAPDSTEAVFTGEIFTGPRTVAYEIEPLAAGTYGFLCTVHPTMKGTLFVTDEGEGHAPAPHSSPPASPTPTPTATATGGAGTGPTTAEIVATDPPKFDLTEMSLRANTSVTVHLENDGTTVHNWSVYTEKGGSEIFKGEIIQPGQMTDNTFTAPAPGEYFFQCDVHPGDMVGTVRFQ